MGFLYLGSTENMHAGCVLWESNASHWLTILCPSDQHRTKPRMITQYWLKGQFRTNICISAWNQYQEGWSWLADHDPKYGDICHHPWVLTRQDSWTKMSLLLRGLFSPGFRLVGDDHELGARLCGVLLDTASLVLPNDTPHGPGHCSWSSPGSPKREGRHQKKVYFYVSHQSGPDHFGGILPPPDPIFALSAPFLPEIREFQYPLKPGVKLSIKGRWEGCCSLNAPETVLPTQSLINTPASTPSLHHIVRPKGVRELSFPNTAQATWLAPPTHPASSHLAGTNQSNVHAN